MRILIVTQYRALVGGTEKYLQSLIPALQKRGHDVCVVYECSCDRSRESIDSSDVILPMWCLADLGIHVIINALAHWKPDIVYSNGIENANFESVLLRDYPTVLFAHGYYGTCGTGWKCHRFPRVQPCSRRFGPACLALHYPRRCGGLNPKKTWQFFMLQARRNSHLLNYRAVLVASAHMRSEFLRHGVMPDKLHLVPLPITENSVRDAHCLSRSPGGRMLMMGRLTEIKGGHYLIPAIALAAKTLGRPLTLSVAGDGPEREILLELARKCGVGAEFWGWLDSERRRDVIRHSDLLAVPSLWPEPFGMVGLEAACHGLPAVAFRVGGIPDWLHSGETGELAPGDPPTVTGLADAIVRALCDIEHYRRLCAGAFEFAQRFTLEAHLLKLEEILFAQ